MLCNERLMDVLCKGVVVRTPRTYGNRKTEDIWRSTIRDRRWDDPGQVTTLQIPVHLDFEFRVNPHSPNYNRNVSNDGPDLDTMVIGALGRLLNCRNPIVSTGWEQVHEQKVNPGGEGIDGLRRKVLDTLQTIFIGR